MASQVVGVIALFFAPAPILMKQGYLVTTGVVTAYTFTFIPEWTTWVMLVAMALYDLCAVLTPHGPLKVSSLASTSHTPRPTQGSPCLPCLYLSPGLLTTLVRVHTLHLVTQVLRQHQAVVTHTSLDTSPIRNHSFGQKHLRLRLCINDNDHL